MLSVSGKALVWTDTSLHMPGSSVIYMSLFYCGPSYYLNPYELSTKPNAPYEKLSFNDIYSSKKAYLIKL